ncbi:MAG: cadherin-like domain-containing protein [Saprospiraceae bacterium]|nr:cadherin-like domain-containing protein [Saprospiraceae bacterium]
MINHDIKSSFYLVGCIILCLLIYFNANGQVSGVKYQLKYNVDSCWFDAFLIIEGGSGNSVTERKQAHSKFSVVVPNGTFIDVVKNYMPIENNEFYDGTDPVAWNINSVVNAPIADPANDYYIISPSSDFDAHYNDIYAGDTIKLFSLIIDSIFNCGFGVRQYDNGSDPGPLEPGMGFINFANTFNMASGSELYLENAPKIHPNPPSFLHPLEASCNLGIEIDLTAFTSSCQTPLSYSWTGPQSFLSENEDVIIENASELNAGNYKVIVTDALGCKDSLTVYAHNKPFAGEDQVLCPGMATMISGAHPTGGLWSSVETNSEDAALGPAINGVAEIEFSNLSSGLYSFIYSASNCTDTVEIYINPAPNLTIVGNVEICIGSMTELNADSEGYWSSSNSAIGSINSSGVVTAINSGTVNFVFTSFSSGCSSVSEQITVQANPIAEFTGFEAVCINSNTSVSPNSDGIWQSSDPTVAVIDNSGFVTGLMPGIAQLYFTTSDAGCISNELSLAVTDQPVGQITGGLMICTANTSQLYPVMGGSWTSVDPLIASVSDEGLITGVSEGTTGFIWTDAATGCITDTTDYISVTEGPNVIMAYNTLCINSSMLLLPNTGGTWSSSDESVAIVGVNTGFVTAMSPGKTVFTYTSQTSGCTQSTDTLTIFGLPQLMIDANPICVGSITTLHPASGGIWSSLDTEIAFTAVNNVFGTGSGIVSLIFMDTITGCSNTIFLNVLARPSSGITEDNIICAGNTTQLSPSEGGVWSSSNSNIAVVNDEGVVTGISQGSAFFIFTESATGCTSLPTSLLTVNSLPLINVTGPLNICLGDTSTLQPSYGGLWQSENSAIASIHPESGQITGISAGTVSFTYTSNSNNCVSLPSDPISVIGEPVASLNGTSSLCIGSLLKLTPHTGGVWSTSDSTVATVNNNGDVLATGVGKVFFTFTETAFGCGYISITDTLTISPCSNPDINVALINLPVSGNLSTNDFSATTGTLYTNPIMTYAPANSNPIFNMNTDGSYIFETNTQGVYIFETEVCSHPTITGCPVSILKIVVKDPLDTFKSVSANADLVFSIINNSVDINTLHNDVCILVGGCNLDPTSISIIQNPIHGLSNINVLNGNIQYVPNQDFIGSDMITYQVCVEGNSERCDTATQLIFVRNPVSENIATATDDVFTTQQEKTISGNVLLNDIDPEGDLLSATPQNTSGVEGSFELTSEGNFIYSPIAGFTGTVRFVYQVCDNNAALSCSYATLYILVLPDLTLKLKVYLEGAILNYGNATASDGRPLMRDNLRVSPFNGSKVIPNSDPYSHPTELIDITNKFTKVGPGQKSEFQHIPNPGIVFAVSGEDAIVDWVFVELRSKSNYANVIATRSGLLQRDGDIVELDGVSSLRFPEIKMDDYFVAVRHRNHLGVMTQNALTAVELTQVIDFRLSSTPTFDFGTTKGNGYDYTGLAQKPVFGNAYRAMWAGDFDASRRVKSGNPNDDLNILFFDVIMFPQNPSGNANYDFVIGYLQGDFDMNSKSKFDNPNDDKNMLFGQVLFYPLNANLLSNFNFMIEQLP